MSECQGHILCFTVAGAQVSSKAWKAVGDEPAGVADLVCLECGEKLFVYYRHGPKEEE